MTFDEYQDRATGTALPGILHDDNYFALGLTGEAGEVAEHFKKGIRDGEISKSAVKKELGDVLWYLSQLARCMDCKLSEVAISSIEKLESRKARGVISGSGDNR
ncbi:nucleoside triphosphate pyrophosphohydrolase family protein [bacterium]|nr:nucleoside triphosphate pyrophosphohydrolase family protein [bacterium]